MEAIDSNSYDQVTTIQNVLQINLKLRSHLFEKPSISLVASISFLEKEALMNSKTSFLFQSILVAQLHVIFLNGLNYLPDKTI